MTSPTWTPEQVIALAPDASSAKSGRELAQPRKWINAGCDSETLWCEHQGSGSKPYQTIIDLATPAFHCSCPSRKFPCKHGLGLFLVYAQQPAIITPAEPPAWVNDWLAGRAKRAQQKAEKASQTEKSPEEQAESAAAQAKRTAARENKVSAGIAELERWLVDLVRGGLARAQTQPSKYWSTMAARLIDAQAPGLANRINDISSIPASGSDWKERLLEALSRLHLLLEAYKRIDQLPAETQADVRSLIGFPVAQEDVLNQPAMRDRWFVQGQRVSEEGNLRTQRTWLIGIDSQRSALILHFAAGGQPLDTSLVVGAAIDAALCFYPSAHPQRALIKERFATQSMTSLLGVPTVDQGLAAFAAALALQPWLERFPLGLQSVTPFFEAEHCWLADDQGNALPIDPKFLAVWKLLALSGGKPLSIFGEWNGDQMHPLSVFDAGRLVML